MEETEKRGIIAGLLLMRCPYCRQGRVFIHRSVIPLGSCLAMHHKCPDCHRQLVNERNNGPGINYALTVILFFLNLAWYWPLFGMSYLDNSIYYYLATSTTVVIIAQPWLMRISRITYLYFFASFYD